MLESSEVRNFNDSWSSQGLINLILKALDSPKISSSGHHSESVSLAGILSDTR